jgi:general L-amino acid transport system substrate-binding protein
VLPEIISKEPLGPAVRHGDDTWLDIVKWTHNAMLNAEELGITKANIDEMLKSDNPEIKRGWSAPRASSARPIGLTNDWAYRIVKHVGNYGEVLREECRLGLASEDRARPERAVDQGRPAIRSADPLS